MYAAMCIFASLGYVVCAEKKSNDQEKTRREREAYVIVCGFFAFYAAGIRSENFSQCSNNNNKVFIY